MPLPLKCSLRGEVFLVHSNLAIVEELLRISEYLELTAFEPYMARNLT